jgi:hypothetical protein
MGFLSGQTRVSRFFDIGGIEDGEAMTCQESGWGSSALLYWGDNATLLNPLVLASQLLLHKSEVEYHNMTRCLPSSGPELNLQIQHQLEEIGTSVNTIGQVSEAHSGPAR